MSPAAPGLVPRPPLAPWRFVVVCLCGVLAPAAEPTSGLGLAEHPLASLGLVGLLVTLAITLGAPRETPLAFVLRFAACVGAAWLTHALLRAVLLGPVLLLVALDAAADVRRTRHPLHPPARWAQTGGRSTLVFGAGVGLGALHHLPAFEAARHPLRNLLAVGLLLGVALVGGYPQAARRSMTATTLFGIAVALGLALGVWAAVQTLAGGP